MAPLEFTPALRLCQKETNDEFLISLRNLSGSFAWVGNDRARYGFRKVKIVPRGSLFSARGQDFFLGKTVFK